MYLGDVVGRYIGGLEGLEGESWGGDWGVVRISTVYRTCVVASYQVGTRVGMYVVSGNDGVNGSTGW